MYQSCLQTHDQWTSHELHVLNATRRMLRHLQKATLLRNTYRRPCSASDHGLRYMSLMSIQIKHFCRSLCSINQKYDRKKVKTADLGWHFVYLLLMTSHICFLHFFIFISSDYSPKFVFISDLWSSYTCIRKAFKYYLWTYLRTPGVSKVLQISIMNRLN